MKQDLYSNEWISAENQSAEIIPKAYREEVSLNLLPKSLFESLNLVKSYDNTNLTVFILSLWHKYRWGLTSFGQNSIRHLIFSRYLPRNFPLTFALYEALYSVLRPDLKNDFSFFDRNI